MAETALTKAEQNALSVSYDCMGTKVDLDIDFVKNYLIRGRSDLVSNQELVFFINTCKMQKLNPLAGNEVYCIKYSKDDPAQVVVGKGAYMRRAYEHPEYVCKEDGITVRRGNDIIQKEGCCLYPGEELIGGWCKVHYMKNGKERVAYKEVALAEYNKGMSNWKSKPATMINKVAVSQCIRDAFPKDYEGVYSEDEMIASGAIPTVYEEVSSETGEVVQKDTVTGEVIEADLVITQAQRRQLFRAAKEKLGDEANAILKQWVSDEGMESTENMPLSVFEKLMERLEGEDRSEVES